MALVSFNAYHSYLKSLEPLNDGERGRLFTALLEYSSTGVEPDLRGNERFVFPMMKEQIDRDKDRYNQRCESNKKNAEMRWHANACEPMRTDANYANVKEKEKEKDKEKDKEKVRVNAHTLFSELKSDYNLSPALCDKISEWLKYKTERRETYKAQGLKTLLRQLETNYQQYGEASVCRLIDDSMANGWKGIIFERLQKSVGTAARRGRLDWIDDI